MSKTILASLIGAVATITAAFIGINYGKTTEQKIIQNEINEAFGGVVNVIGDENVVTINDIKELLADYQNITEQKESLLEQNAKYFDDLTNANEEIKNLQSQMKDNPIFEYNSVGLSIDGEDITINKNDAMLTIDGRDYFSREIVENLIPDNQNMTLKDNILFIGKIIANKTKLFDQWVMESRSCENVDAISDSYGNQYTNSLVLWSREGYITYSLKDDYKYLKLSISSYDEGDNEVNGIVTIKADGETIYTSPSIDIFTKTINIDIPINDCSTLTICGNGEDYYRIIISNAVVYN